MATKDGIVEWDEELGMQMRTAVPLVTLHPSSAVITILDTDGRHVRQPVGAVRELSLLPPEATIGFTSEWYAWAEDGRSVGVAIALHSGQLARPIYIHLSSQQGCKSLLWQLGLSG